MGIGGPRATAAAEELRSNGKLENDVLSYWYFFRLEIRGWACGLRIHKKQWVMICGLRIKKHMY